MALVPHLHHLHHLHHRHHFLDERLLCCAPDHRVRNGRNEARSQLRLTVAGRRQPVAASTVIRVAVLVRKALADSRYAGDATYATEMDNTAAQVARPFASLSTTLVLTNRKLFACALLLMIAPLWFGQYLPMVDL